MPKMTFHKYMKNIKIFFVILSLVFALSSRFAAQNVTFTSLDGGKFDLASQKGKVVVLAIGASWLPLSKNQAVIINKLAKKYTAERRGDLLCRDRFGDREIEKLCRATTQIRTFATRTS